MSEKSKSNSKTVVRRHDSKPGKGEVKGKVPTMQKPPPPPPKKTKG